MSIFKNVSGAVLRQAAAIKEKIESLESQLAGLLDGRTVDVSLTIKAPKIKKPAKAKRRMSATGRARIVAAQKARWAKVRSAKSSSK